MSSSLLLIDEMGYDPMSREEASLFFRLVSYRCGRGALAIRIGPRMDGSLITTSNSIRDWTELLTGDEVLATVRRANDPTDHPLILLTLDCLLYRAHVLNFKGRSYRLRDPEEKPSRAKPDRQPTAAHSPRRDTSQG